MIDIIPAIDLMDGKCVRLSKGNYLNKKVYADNPVEVAKAFEEHGIHRLHLVDLDGAKSQHIVNHKVLKDIATHTSLNIDFGGGIKNDEDLEIAFDNGAQMVTIGSVAATHPELFERWLQRFGTTRFILAADAKDGYIAPGTASLPELLPSERHHASIVYRHRPGRHAARAVHQPLSEIDETDALTLPHCKWWCQFHQ